MDLNVGDSVRTTQSYNDFFGRNRIGIVKYIQYGEFITIICNDGILRPVHINWLEKVEE